MADVMGFLKSFKKAVVPSGKEEWKKAGKGALMGYAKARTGGATGQAARRTSMYQAAGTAAGKETPAYKAGLKAKAEKKGTEKKKKRKSVYNMLMELAQKNYERNA